MTNQQLKEQNERHLAKLTSDLTEAHKCLRELREIYLFKEPKASIADIIKIWQKVDEILT